MCNPHAHKKTVCQKDSYSLDTAIAAYIFDFLGNAYIQDYKNMWPNYDEIFYKEISMKRIFLFINLKNCLWRRKFK